MSGRRPRGTSGDEPSIVLGILAAAILAPAFLVWVPLALAQPPDYPGGGPVSVLLALVRGRITWTAGATAYAAGEAAVLGVLAGLGWLLRRRGREVRSRVDWAARRMAKPRDLAKLSPAHVAKSAQRLRPRMPATSDPDEHGVPIGTTVYGAIALRQTWEDMAIDIWGPRTGKTTSRAIPAIVAAPGPVVITSVKGDIVDTTHDVRARRGRCWVFDPMYLMKREVNEPGSPTFYWNPLRGITTITAARLLAEHFSFSEQSNGTMSPRDPFFDTKAQDFIAALILAAAITARTLIDVYLWTTNQRETEPGDILKAHGYALPAESMYGVLAMPDRTRGSVYAIAEASLSVLTEPSVTDWITPGHGNMDEFLVDAFVVSTDSLYLLSRGGPGSPAPLIAAFVDAVQRAGEAAARRSPGRRLDPPMLTVADEAANIVRIKRLPDLFSFYGSLGLPAIVILQSYAQGEMVWGAGDMKKMWDAANVRTYGGGVVDIKFLEDLSRLIGHDWQMVKSVSTQSRSWDRTVNRQPQRLPLLEVDDLMALPVGRMILIPSGAPAVLVRTQPWQAGPYADQVRESLAHWDPDPGEHSYDPALLPEDTLLETRP
ncbi:type IV secretory system conjugative DNA transfer family protein [Hamadaea tsunoensis]|uniref:type IV secretory system conjugative DNA transfer family protein n=1 Tax=Hamadaea tsunoensis TaxID=53368 RepID=UPI00041D104A|nr:TraM recognition domain-containing protein [Hamadaea tsunoensis]